MPITIDGTGSITGLSAGGLPDGSVVTADLAEGAVTQAKRSEQLTLGTAQASTSGTNIDFTGIPSWVKRVTVMFNGVSTSGSSAISIRVGTSGGVVSTGYTSGDWAVTTAVASAVGNSTSGFNFSIVGSGSVQQGLFVLAQVDSTAWVGQGSFYDNNPTVRMAYVTGRVAGLGSALTQLRITTVNGTDTFDAGSINIMYE
jgi:hypothetical protein